MKKAAFILIALILTELLSACSSQNIPLTDKESDAIAQYCAHLLLKYDKNKVDDRKLMDVNELEDYYKELHKDDKPTPSPTPKPEPTKEAPKPTQGTEQEATPVPTSSENNNPVQDDNREKAASLTEIFGQKDFSIEYKNSELLKNYSENEYSTFTAKTGEMLFYVEFTIKNTSGSKAKFVSGSSNVGYALYCDNGDIYAPELAMLSNDIRFLKEDIGSGKEYNAVLLFIINENNKPVRLRTENGETGKVFDITF